MSGNYKECTTEYGKNPLYKLNNLCLSLFKHKNRILSLDVKDNPIFI